MFFSGLILGLLLDHSTDQGWSSTRDAWGLGMSSANALLSREA